MSERGVPALSGTSQRAVEAHYDYPAEFFAQWLGEDLVYSCAFWDGIAAGDLSAAQQAKLDYFIEATCPTGGRLLDVGCGWGALLDRAARRYGVTSGVGLTLSPSQLRFAERRGVPGMEYRLENWLDHQPELPYRAICCIEATEHFATDAADEDGKVDAYRAFFERCASWLEPKGRLGLQLICLDNASHADTRGGHGSFTELIRKAIFPESMSASLSEMVLGWERQFRVVTFVDHTDQYRRTFRAWATAARRGASEMERLVGSTVQRTFMRYFAAGEALFRLREQALYRVVLERRNAPKQWSSPTLTPSAIAAAGALASRGASVSAVQSHYDVSNDFYALWLGPLLMYTSGMWRPDQSAQELGAAEAAKIVYFADRSSASASSRVLDVGCGWGGNLRRLLETGRMASGVGLTLSAAQVDHARSRADSRIEIRLEPWEEHDPVRLYDMICSYGAFEHFARDGSTAIERVLAYRHFFDRCSAWLVERGTVALESITHDDAPETSSPLGRGPLGDFVLELFPESICPNLSELVLGFEPYFEVEILRSDPADFARTSRAWLLELRSQATAAEALVGRATVRNWLRYLAASEIQFRDGTLTNTRLVLRKRPRVRGSARAG